MIAFCTLFLLSCPSFLRAHPLDDAPSVHTSSGILHGLRVSTPLGFVDQFLGVPYAQAPVDGLRFKPPEPLKENRSRIHVDANNYAASCMQPPHLKAAMYPQINRNESKHAISEDCLYLNIYIPTATRKEDNLPILVWIPGEGFNYASSRQFDGSTLASFGKVIVITVNYRVSAFGFLSVGTDDAPGNLGIWDKIAALKWIKENANAFQGDAQRVTLAGRFTGAMSITALISSPLAMHDGSPLFHRAIIQSGVADGGNWIFDRNPTKGARKLARKVGCKSTESKEKLIDCLRKIDAETLNDAAAYLHSWRLVTNDKVLPVEPLKAIQSGKHLPIPVILGYTNDEGAICVLTQKLMNSPYFSQLVDDTLDRGAFTILARGYFNQYLAADENVEQTVKNAVEQYEKSSGSWRDRYVKMCGDVYVKHKIKSMAQQLSIHGSRVYLYEFVHRPEESIYPDFVRGAHGDDILFTFGLVHESRRSTTAEKRLSDEMMSAWTSFVKKGEPNPMLDADQEWPAYSVVDKKFWVFSTLSSDKVKSMKEDKVNSKTDSETSNLLK